MTDEAWVRMVEPTSLVDGLETGEQRREQSTPSTGFWLEQPGD